MGRVKDNPLPSHIDETTLANDFLTYFLVKITKLRNKLDNIEPESVINMITETPSEKANLNEFQTLSENPESKIILESKPTTCDFDILLTPCTSIFSCNYENNKQL